MTDLFRPFLRGAAVLVAASVLAACEDSTSSNGGRGEAAVVVNSTNRSLTVVPLDSVAGKYTVGLGAQGSPVSIAVRGETAVVPMGTYPFAKVVNLSTGATVWTVALPEGSGATGAAFLNDSIALVANSGLNSVTPVNVLRGTTKPAIPTGAFPQAVVVTGGRAYIVNAELENFVPARSGTLTVINGDLTVGGTITLTGFNPATAVARGSRLYVIHSGSFGANDGSMSVVDLTTQDEVDHIPGFGDFPGALAAEDDRLYVTNYGVGILVYDLGDEAFVHGPASPLVPTGFPPVSGLGFDSRGRLWALNPGFCDGPGKVAQVTTAGAVVTEAETGVCPFAIAFARVRDSELR